MGDFIIYKCWNAANAHDHLEMCMRKDNMANLFNLGVHRIRLLMNERVQEPRAKQRKKKIKTEIMNTHSGD